VIARLVLCCQRVGDALVHNTADREVFLSVGLDCYSCSRRTRCHGGRLQREKARGEEAAHHAGLAQCGPVLVDKRQQEGKQTLNNRHGHSARRRAAVVVIIIIYIHPIVFVSATVLWQRGEGGVGLVAPVSTYLNAVPHKTPSQQRHVKVGEQR
jgi:hypothetical protein